MRQRGNITLKDIANECCLSVSTISKILSGNDNFKQETIDLVFETAKRLGYAPNLFARSMVTKESNKIIGFFIPNILNPFFSELVNSLEKKLSKHGYLLALCIYDDNPEKMSRFINFLVEMRVDGMIFAALREETCSDVFELAKKYTSLVSIQADIDGIDRVDVTDQLGTYEMIEYLIKNGHSKIGFIGYNYKMQVLNNRRKGYLNALKDNNIPFRDDYLRDGMHHEDSGYNMTKDLMALSDPPTAIHCMNEFMATGAIRALRELNISIPDDISITAFDGLKISEILEPGLTTILDPIDLLADVAVGMMLERIEEMETGTYSNPKHIMIRHQFIERNSVKNIKEQV